MTIINTIKSKSVLLTLIFIISLIFVSAGCTDKAGFRIPEDNLIEQDLVVDDDLDDGPTPPNLPPPIAPPEDEPEDPDRTYR